jgi:hypothetical protein
MTTEINVGQMESGVDVAEFRHILRFSRKMRKRMLVMKADKKHSASAADRRVANGAAHPSVPDGTNAAAPADDFGPWFAAQSGRLPPDFELEL